jgi:hypothetical protein
MLLAYFAFFSVERQAMFAKELPKGSSIFRCGLSGACDVACVAVEYFL